VERFLLLALPLQQLVLNTRTGLSHESRLSRPLRRKVAGQIFTRDVGKEA
jgi:hypothetical protein